MWRGAHRFPVSNNRGLFNQQETRMALTALQIAQVCHEVNRAYCQALGDDSQPAWDDAPD